MTLLATVSIQPRDILDYDIDCSRWLPPGDTMATAELLSVTPPGPRVAPVVQGDIVKVWFSFGENGATHKVELLLSSAGGRVVNVEMKFKVKEV